jgi:hypothetical protein
MWYRFHEVDIYGKASQDSRFDNPLEEINVHIAELIDKNHNLPAIEKQDRILVKYYVIQTYMENLTPDAQEAISEQNGYIEAMEHCKEPVLTLMKQKISQLSSAIRAGKANFAKDLLDDIRKDIKRMPQNISKEFFKEDGVGSDYIRILKYWMDKSKGPAKKSESKKELRPIQHITSMGDTKRTSPKVELLEIPIKEDNNCYIRSLLKAVADKYPEKDINIEDVVPKIETKLADSGTRVNKEFINAGGSDGKMVVDFINQNYNLNLDVNICTYDSNTKKSTVYQAYEGKDPVFIFFYNSHFHAIKCPDDIDIAVQRNMITNFLNENKNSLGRGNDSFHIVQLASI